MSVAFRIRSYVNEMFSEFRRFIAPTYFHDRCERSLHMHIYVMHKREVLLSLAGFICSFILLLFIGLAGPNVTKLQTTKATEMTTTNGTSPTDILKTGPFTMYIDSLSTYSQHLYLYVRFYLKNEEMSETFNKNFIIALKINSIQSDAITSSMTNQSTTQANSPSPIGVTVLNEDINLGGGRIHTLICTGSKCNSIQVFHLEFLEYSSYAFEVNFRELDSVETKYGITDIKFTFQSTNTSFTTLTIWFRFVFLTTAFLVTCWFTHSLNRYSFAEWSLEQKWTAGLLPSLILYNNPFYPMAFLYGSPLSSLMEVIFKTSFYTTMAMFWLVFFHGIRQTHRSLGKFYIPKIVVTFTLFFTTCYTCSWSKISRLQKPTMDEIAAFNSSSVLSAFSQLFYFALVFYIIYLTVLMLVAFTELRAMPYFDLRIKFQGASLAFFIAITSLVVSANQSNSSTPIEEVNEVTNIRFLQLIPFVYESSSSTSFLTLYSLANLYVYSCAYFYYPSTGSLVDARIVRDNPTLSMMNDSDEEVIYSSEMEQPLNQVKLIDTPDDDDESD